MLSRHSKAAVEAGEMKRLAWKKATSKGAVVDTPLKTMGSFSRPDRRKLSIGIRTLPPPHVRVASANSLLLLQI